MANYRNDFADVNLETGTICRNFMNHSIGSGDALGDRFGVRVFRNGEPVSLGGTVAGYFVRNTTGETVVISSGVVSGNEAYVTLPAACYAVEGSFTLAIKVTSGSETVTMRIVDGVVSRTNTSVTVDPGTLVPSIETLISAINSAVGQIPVNYNASFAPAYSASSTYAVGDYVVYDGYLWRCTTAITETETWTAAHWTKVALASDVSDLKSAYNYAIKEVNEGIMSFAAYGNFEHYGLQPNGTFDIGVKYRVSNDNPISFSRDITVRTKTGFKWGYIPFTGTTPGSWSGWSSGDRTITAGTSFVVQIARTSENTSEIADVNEFVNALTFDNILTETKANKVSGATSGDIVILNDSGDLEDSGRSFTVNEITDDIRKSEKGEQSFYGFGNFKNYGLNEDGSFATNQRYRVSNNDTMTFDRNITVSVASGFKFGFQKIVGSSIVWSGWNTSPTIITSGTVFRIQIARITENTSEIASVVEFLSKLSFITHYTNEINKVKEDIDDLRYLENPVYNELQLNAIGKESFWTYADFAIGGLNTDGSLIPSQTTRVSSTKMMTFNRDLIVSVKSGYRFGYLSLPVGSSTGQWSGWNTTGLTIPKNTRFAIQISKSPEDETTADPFEMSSAITFINGIASELNLNENKFSYIGNVKPANQYFVEILTQLETTLETYAADGMSIAGNVMAMLFNGGGILLYNLETKTILGQYMLACAGENNHANSASFSTEHGTAYPYLYVSECYGQHRCFVMDIQNSTSAIKQTITFDNANGDYDGAYDWILDNYSGRIMTYGMKGSKYMIKVFASIPSLTNASIILTENDVIDSWTIDDEIGETMYLYQGNCVIGNNIYLPASVPERLIVIDKNSHKLVGKLNIGTDYPNFNEFEDVALWGSELIGITTNRTIFKIVL